MKIDGNIVEFSDERNVLEIIRKVGIELPTFCYYSELSTYGACRLCVVEDSRGKIEASCSLEPWEGLEIKTNTERLRKYRKNILELLLSSHCRDCTLCAKNNHCKLQELAEAFGIREVRFKNEYTDIAIDTSSPSIVRDQSKCILCGDCVRSCSEKQGVGAIDFVDRGSHMRVSTAFDKPLAETNCVACGQCVNVCPTGALTINQSIEDVYTAIADKDTLVVAQVAPAVRVGITKELGVENGENVMGKVCSALSRLGFDLVFDTATGADMTIIEETAEFADRLENGGVLPLMTSCCPAWVKHVENKYPQFLPNISTAKSPMSMFSPVIKEYFKEKQAKKVVTVAIMPCTAKKLEASREEFTNKDGEADTNYVLTTVELINMIKRAGIKFDELPLEGVSMPFGMRSGAGVIFGSSGGVTEAVMRKTSDDRSINNIRNMAVSGVRGIDGLKEFTIVRGGKELKIAVVSGLANAEKLLERIENKEVEYHFVEVMACSGGCINGGGQPLGNREVIQRRSESLYTIDRLASLKVCDENPFVNALYTDGFLKDKAHEMLHYSYVDGKH